MPAPRPVRFTAKEVQALIAAIDWVTPSLSSGVGVYYDIRHKLEASVAPAPKGPAAGALEEALVGAAGAKVARLAGPSGYARASRRAAQLGATPEQVAEVGRWVARWWSRGPLTLLDVFAHWDTWLPKALAEQGPKGIPEGLNGGRTADLGQGAPAPGGARPAGRRAPGLR